MFVTGVQTCALPIYALTAPKFFIPLHGEQRMLQIHSELAQSMGMPAKNVAIAENGSVIELTHRSIRVSGSVPAGQVLVDGYGVGDVGAVVLRDRKHLAEDGMVVVNINLSAQDGGLLAPPDIITRGFIYVKESGDLMQELQDVVADTVSKARRGRRGRGGGDGDLRGTVKSAVSSYLYKTTRRSPMVLPIVNEL